MLFVIDTNVWTELRHTRETGRRLTEVIPSRGWRWSQLKNLPCIIKVFSSCAPLLSSPPLHLTSHLTSPHLTPHLTETSPKPHRNLTETSPKPHRNLTSHSTSLFFFSSPSTLLVTILLLRDRHEGNGHA